MIQNQGTSTPSSNITCLICYDKDRLIKSHMSDNSAISLVVTTVHTLPIYKDYGHMGAQQCRVQHGNWAAIERKPNAAHLTDHCIRDNVTRKWCNPKCNKLCNQSVSQCQISHGVTSCMVDIEDRSLRPHLFYAILHIIQIPYKHPGKHSITHFGVHWCLFLVYCLVLVVYPIIISDGELSSDL